MMCDNKMDKDKAMEIKEKWNEIASSLANLSTLEKLLLCVMLESESIDLSRIQNRVESLQV